MRNTKDEDNRTVIQQSENRLEKRGEYSNDDDDDDADDNNKKKKVIANII